MADPDQRRHLLLPSPGEAMAYTYPQDVRGTAGVKTPTREREVHGAKLLKQLSALRDDLPELQRRRAALGVAHEGGLYIEFESEPTFELALKSFERRDRKKARKHIELVAVRERAGITYATVYVPDGKLADLERLVEQYVSQETETGKPRNRDFVEGISRLRRAALASLWTDEPDLMPIGSQEAWWEVWLRRSETEENLPDRFRAFAKTVGLSVSDAQVEFVDRTILLARGNADQVTQSMELLDCVAELRRAKDLASAFTEMPPNEQQDWASELAGRVVPPGPDAPAVCILDSGVTREHVLLKPALEEGDVHTYHPEWGVGDSSRWRGHGTQMAGLGLYGDLRDPLNTQEKVVLEHRLEVVKVLPPEGYRPNRPDLYGSVTEDAISRPEIAAPNRKRVFGLAVTSEDGRDRGSPSSWSATIDKLAYADGGETDRLFVLSAGNIDNMEAWKDYPEANDVEQVRDPAQAWNALTVGAFTEKCVLDASVYPGWQPIAKSGALAPSSTTSMTWKAAWPTKPDVVLEGGNGAIEPGTGSPDAVEDLSLVTTRALPGKAFVATGDTSAAAAQAARMAAILRARYPTYWPQTIRALIVHSARWTAAMQEAARGPKGERHNVLLRRHGYGVPSIERACWSASNRLTLVAQDSIKPYKISDSRVATDEAKLHQLPWPSEALEALHAEQVRLRVTLSYFVEPNPARRGFKYRHQYASHGLRLRMIRADEDVAEFRARVSKTEQSPDDDTDLRQSKWALGHNLRSRGSIHSDWWEGPAVELSARSVLAVYPVGGWWKDRRDARRWDRRVRYALIVSIETRRVDVDIYTPVENAIATTVLV